MTIKEHYADILCNSRASEEKIITVTSAAELSALTAASSQRLYLDLVLNRTLDYEAAIELAKQKLTPRGELLVLLASIAPEQDEVESFWGFTLASAKYIFRKHFAEKDFEVFGYGNVLVGRILLTGGSAEDLQPAELAFVDPYYPVYVGVRAINQ